jgi:inorganic pyrophosphatase
MNLLALPPLAEHNAFHVVIESPRGSTLKLKYSPEWGTMGVSRPLPAGLVFPFESGFVPSTRSADGDPLDGKDAIALGWGGRDDALSLIASNADVHRTT